MNNEQENTVIYELFTDKGIKEIKSFIGSALFYDNELVRGSGIVFEHLDDGKLAIHYSLMSRTAKKLFELTDKHGFKQYGFITRNNWVDKLEVK